MDFEFIRGDTFRFKFELLDNEGNVLTLSSGDELYFTVKKNYNDNEYILQKRYSTGTIEYADNYYYITLGHEDTADLDYGNYVYDIQLKSGSLVKTLVLGNIALTEEVTHISNE